MHAYSLKKFLNKIFSEQRIISLYAYIKKFGKILFYITADTSNEILQFLTLKTWLRKSGSFMFKTDLTNAEILPIVSAPVLYVIPMEKNKLTRHSLFC